jgi:predicted flap endonuclease-1-like 5' DNA nuclease
MGEHLSTIRIIVGKKNDTVLTKQGVIEFGSVAGPDQARP